MLVLSHREKHRGLLVHLLQIIMTLNSVLVMHFVF